MSTRSTAGTVVQAIVLLIARLGFAVILVGRAWWRWGVEGMAAQTARIAEFGIPQAELIAWGTLLLEAIGGVLLALGLLTRLVAALVAVENIIVIVIMRWAAGIHLFNGGFEYNLALASLGLVFLAVGASHAGLDAVLFRRRQLDASDPGSDLYQPRLGSTQL